MADKEKKDNSEVRVIQRKNPYAMIDSTGAEDKTLSLASKGLLWYLLSRPPGWTILKADLHKRSASGSDALETAMWDLMECGYVWYFADRDDKGQVKKWVYEVYQDPAHNPHREEAQAYAAERKQKKKERIKRKNDKRLGNGPEPDNPEVDGPEPDNPEMDNPEMGNPVHNNKHISNNHLSIKQEEEEEDRPAAIHIFFTLCFENKITAKLQESIFAHNEPAILAADPEALRRSIVKLKQQLRKGEIATPAAWFATTLQNETINVEMLEG